MSSFFTRYQKGALSLTRCGIPPHSVKITKRGTAMIDIDEMTKLLEKRPLDLLVYSLKDERFLREDEMKKMDLSKDQEGFCYLCGPETCYKAARGVFRNKHRDIFPKAPSSYSYKKWFETIIDKNLENEWFLELRQALAENFTQFTKHYGLQEIEAPSIFYEEIRKELSILEKAHYEKRYSDMVLFHLRTPYDIVPFTILGNAGNVFGISLYPCDDDGTCFLRTQLNEALHMDQHTLSALSDMLSFYFEKEGENDMEIVDNPFGKENHYTSLYMANGSFMKVYLPKSIAIRALDYLKTVNLMMPEFDKSNGKLIEDNQFYDVYLDIDHPIPIVFEKDIEEDADAADLFPMIDPEVFPEARYRYATNKEWEITIRALPNYFFDSKDSVQRGHFGLVCLACDRKTGQIEMYELGECANFRLFDDLALRLEKKFKDIRIPKKIYVNTYLDFVFFPHFFGEDFLDKKVDIIPTTSDLTTDEAFEKMLEYFSMAAEEDVHKC